MKSLFAYSLKFATYSLIFACLIFLAAPAAHAQSLSLSIWPPLLEVMIQPGKSITQVYKLSNEGETDLVVKGEILAFNPLGEQGEIQLSDQQSPAHEWISFQNADLGLGQNFAVKAGQSQQIVLKIKVPLEAKEDDYYLTLLFETQPSALNENLSEAQARAKIGANILLTVSETGEPPRKAEISEFKVQSAKFKIIDSFTRPQFLLRVKNTGRSFFKPMGTITTTGWLGQKFISDLLPENILTNSVRAINCATPDSPDRVSPCQINTRFLLGPYQARVEFGLDKISSDYTAKINFIALPIKLILGILILVILFIVIKFSQKKFKISLDK
jgi:hypothetical protein